MTGFIDERARLSGRTAVVCGGGGGLGRAITVAFAGAGMSLAVCDRDAAALEETVSEAGRGAPGGHRPVATVLDVRDSASLADFFSEAADRFDHLDALVNVVGGTFAAPFVSTDRRGWDALIRTNYLWLLDAVSCAVVHMAADGERGHPGGSIVNLTSIEAHRAAPGYAVYASLKAAVAHLSGTLAVELGPSGIRVNCIACDFVPTPAMRVLADDQRPAAPARRRTDESGQTTEAETDPTTETTDVLDTVTLPLGRKATPDDVANTALFLASDLSASITGSTLHPDGGALAASGWLRWPDEGWRARPPRRTVTGPGEPA